MQIPIAHGSYADAVAADFRTTLPRNLVPVPKETGISAGYLRPADGIEKLGDGPGPVRGGINWGGSLYRVMGAKLVRVDVDSAVTELATIPGDAPVTMDYSFDRLGIAAGGGLYYWNGSSLTQVVDPDLGTVKDMKWIAGYFLTTDGVDLITTDLNDPSSVQTTHYGSAEADPDPVQAVDELRNEAYAFGRYTVEVYQNVGGNGFPFQRVEGAQVTKGVIGTHAYCGLGDTFMMLGSGRGEAPAVYVMTPGNVQKVSTREVDTILLGYSEDQLSSAVMEARVDKNHQHVLLHLPDRTLVYDTIGSQAAGDQLWHTLDSGIETPEQYRGRFLVWCYDQWNIADPSSTSFGRLTSAASSHYGDVVGWEFGTPIIYNGGNPGIVHELELVCLSGRVALEADPVVWTSYSLDGVTWSMERPAKAGRKGQRSKRIAWRGQGRIQHWRAQKFRGTSDAHLAVARLEAQIEPLFTRPGAGNG